MSKPLAIVYALNGNTSYLSDNGLEDFLSQPVDLIPYSAHEYLVVNRIDQKEKELPENYAFPYLYGEVLCINKNFLQDKLAQYRKSPKFSYWTNFDLQKKSKFPLGVYEIYLSPDFKK